MGILGQTSNFQKCIKKTNKIPEYARDFRNEYLFIRGINKTCEIFVKKLDVDAKIFDTPQAYQLMLFFRRFLKAKELGYLDDNKFDHVTPIRKELNWLSVPSLSLIHI